MSDPSFNFEHLSVGQRITRFTFYQVAGEPWVDVVHAGEANKKYFNALLKRSRRNMRRIKSGAVDAATMQQNRDEDRGLYPKFIVKAWGYKKDIVNSDEQEPVDGFILDSEGNEIPFNSANVFTFLRALPNWLFDDLRLFAAEESNFLDEDDEDEEVPEPETVAKN